MGKRLQLVGQRFGKLVAVQDLGNKGQHSYWLCRCDCGGEARVTGGCLRQGKQQSCGCVRRENGRRKHQKGKGEAGFNHILKAYQIGARKRGLAWELTIEQFRALTQMNCHYCGGEPRTISEREYKLDGSAEWGRFVYNGVDRVDSNDGYNAANCVTCCKTCNIAKSNLPLDEFLGWVSRVFAHSVAKGSHEHLGLLPSRQDPARRTSRSAADARGGVGQVRCLRDPGADCDRQD